MFRREYINYAISTGTILSNILTFISVYDQRK